MQDIIGKLDSRFSGYFQQDAQEFLLVLLKGLHEELNTISDKPYIKQIIDPTDNDQIASDKCWDTFRKRNKSKIIEIFNGQIKTSYKCSACDYKERNFEVFSQLILPIADVGHDLKDCLELYFTFNQSTKWLCDGCNQFTTTTSTKKISKLPQILIIYLKRFQVLYPPSVFRYRTTSLAKVKTFINFGNSTLDLKDYYFNEHIERDKCTYNLYGIINHHGHSLDVGHYTAYVLSDKVWYKCDDTVCTTIDQSAIATKDAYVLFYQRR
jgi:ubiquitin C-terminal hydrolase